MACVIKLKLFHFFLLGFFVPLILGLVCMTLITVVPFVLNIDSWLNPVYTSSSRSETQTANLLALYSAYSLQALFQEAKNQMEIFHEYTSTILDPSFKSIIPTQTPYGVAPGIPTIYSVPSIDSSFSLTAYTDFAGNQLHSTLFDISVTSVSQLYATPQYATALKASNVQSLSRGIFLSGGIFTKGFIGIGDTFVKYPLTDYTSYLTQTFQCPTDSTNTNFITVTGFRARCRLWYYQTVGKGNATMFSEPYVDALTLSNAISVSKALLNSSNGQQYGAVGADISMSLLSSVVVNRCKILTNGYCFLISSQSLVIVHPAYKPSPNINAPSISALEPEWAAQVLKNPLSALTLTAHTYLQVVSTQYQKSDGTGTWVSSGVAIPIADYVLVTVYPVSDVYAPFDSLKSTAQSSDTSAIIALLVSIFVFSLFLFFFISRSLSHILSPISEFTRILSQLTANNFDVNIAAIDPAASAKEIRLLHGNFQSVLTAVRFGNEAYYAGNLSKALANYLEAEELMRTMENQRGLGVVLNNKANVLHALGKENESQELYDEAIENARGLLAVAELKYKDRAASKIEKANRNLASARIVLANRLMNKGVFFVDSAMNNTAKENADVSAADLRSALRNSKYDAAIKLFDEAMKLHRQADHAVGIAKVSTNIARIYVDRNELEHAREVLSDAFELLNAKNDEIGLQHVALSFGGLYEKEKNLNEAIKWYRYALETFKRNESAVQKQCLRRLAHCFGLQGDSATAAAICKLIDEKFTDNMPKYVTFVLDCSGSMAGDPIRQCRESIALILRDYLTEADYLSLIRFDSQVHSVVDMSQKTAANDIWMREAIFKQTPTNGSTAFYEAMRQALAVTVTEKKANRDEKKAGGNGVDVNRNVNGAYERWQICLTDGEDNSSPPNALPAVQDLLKRYDGKLVVITVGRIETESILKGFVQIVNEKCSADNRRGFYIHVKGGADRNGAGSGSDSIRDAFQKVAQLMVGQLNVEVL